MKIAVVIQARMASSRLPGKVLLDLAGAPLLQRMIERVRTAKTEFEVVVATSADTSCDEIAALCHKMQVTCFRGHPTDLLDRHVGAAKLVSATVVAKVPSDCPLIDPTIIDRVLSCYLEHQADYDFVSNLHPPTYPDGNDVEVMPTPILEQAWREAREPMEREHTTPYVWNRPERFRLKSVTWETGLDFSKTHRFTVDYIHDYRLVAAVYNALYQPQRPDFSLQEILDFLASHPEVAALNQRWVGTSWHAQHRAEIRNLAALGDTFQE
jgi:spore coat polysaccharide biosynthesis protein SpsF